MSTNSTAPIGSIVPTSEELPVLRLSNPECPDCGSPVSKNGGYERHPHGCQPVRVQRYICANCCSFSPTHPSVEDEHHYPRAVTQLATAVDVLTDSSLENRQDLLTIHYDVRPSARVSTPTTNSISLVMATAPIDSPSTMSYSVRRSPNPSATGVPKRPSVSFSQLSLPRNQFTLSQPTVDQTTQIASRTILTLHTIAVASTSSKTANRSCRTLFSRVFATQTQSDFAVLSSGVSARVSSLHSRTKPQSVGLRRCSITSSTCQRSYARPSKT